MSVLMVLAAQQLSCYPQPFTLMTVVFKKIIVRTQEALNQGWLKNNQPWFEAETKGYFTLIHSSFRGLIRFFVEKWITFFEGDIFIRLLIFFPSGSFA